MEVESKTTPTAHIMGRTMEQGMTELCGPWKNNQARNGYMVGPAEHVATKMVEGESPPLEGATGLLPMQNQLQSALVRFVSRKKESGRTITMIAWGGTK